MTGPISSVGAVLAIVALVLFAGMVNWLATWIIVEGVIFDGPRAWAKRRAGPKVAELLSCHLCMGMWVGFAIAALVPGPFANVILDGLLYKAIGHLTLEVATILRYLVARLKPAEMVYHQDVGPLANARVLREAEAIASA